MNCIIHPITPDKLCGFDDHGQLFNIEVETDGTQVGRIIRDVRKETCMICSKGWELTSAGLRDQYRMSQHDSTVHMTCFSGYNRLRNRSMWYDIACDMKLNRRGFRFEETKNQYGSDAWSGPWYRIAWKDVPGVWFVVGARKRVYHIEIEGVNSDEAKKLDVEFADEDVTKFHEDASWCIHAWTKEKALDYLVRLQVSYTVFQSSGSEVRTS